ncbi:hypothetical protein L1887_24468 [Cichorium endivia]|nr:hypothetical protein L1887_24468 [Cichorium endivia]
MDKTMEAKSIDSTSKKLKPIDQVKSQKILCYYLDNIVMKKWRKIRGKEIRHDSGDNSPAKLDEQVCFARSSFQCLVLKNDDFITNINTGKKIKFLLLPAIHGCNHLCFPE